MSALNRSGTIALDMRNNASLIYNVVLVVGDFLALVAAFIAAFLLRVRWEVGIAQAPLPPESGRAFIGAFLVILPLWIVIFFMLGLYNSNIYERRFKEFSRLLVGSFIGLLLVIFWNFLSSEPIFPARLVPIYGFIFGFLFLLTFRTLARGTRIQLFKRKIGLTRVLLVGNTDSTREILDWLSDSKHSGYQVTAVIGGKKAAGDRNIPLYHSFDQFLEADHGELHGIIQTELYADEARNSKILAYAQERHTAYRFVPSNNGLFVGNIEVELFRNSLPVIAVHQTPLFGWGRVVKRLFDMAVGGLLLIIALPFILIIYLIIKLGDPGAPALFRPKRLGRFNNKITIYKFRSMKSAYSGLTPEQGFEKMGRPELIKQYRSNGDQLERDPRVSRIGRFLRSTSLDELPQLFNVVRGDLSLVGPRPLDPFEIESHPNKNIILTVKNGLTGLAQVSGRRDISFEERRRLDLYYAQNWSLWLDIVILIKTIGVVVGRRGTN